MDDGSLAPWMRQVDVAILNLLAESGLRLTPAVIAANIDYSRNYVSRRCTSLKTAGLIFKDEHRMYVLTNFGARVHAESIPVEELSPGPPETYHGYLREKQSDPVYADDTPLQARINSADHDITEFTWGYIGKGPRDLAYALLADVSDGATATEHATTYMHDVTAMLDPDWELTRSEIEDWINRETS